MFRFVKWLAKPRATSHSRKWSRLRLESLEDRALPSAGVREEFMLEMINRMRSNPAGELPLLINNQDSAIQSNLAYFYVNPQVLAQQWSTLHPVGALIWNDNLATAAHGHSQLMLQDGQQAHQLPGEPDPFTRMGNAGYPTNGFLGENIAAYAGSPFEAHASLAIDWGPTATGIQDPPGHRENLMDTSFQEVGIGLVDAPAGASIGPMLTTEDFGSRSTFGNAYIVGAAFADNNGDGFYSPGAGFGGATIIAIGSNGTFTTTTTAAGGYQLQLPHGTYTVMASGGGMPVPVSHVVTIGSTSVWLDMVDPPLHPIVYAVQSGNSLSQFPAANTSNQVVPSGVTAVSSGPGTTFVVGTDGSLFQHNAAGSFQLASAGLVLVASGGADSSGNAVVDAIGTDHSLWQHDVTGWHQLAGSSLVLAASSGPGGSVFAIGNDRSLWEHDPAGWHQLASAGLVLTISTGSDTSGQPLVDAIGTDHSLWQHDSSGWRELASANLVQSVSTGPADTVFVTGLDNSLWEDSLSGWVQLDANGTPNGRALHLGAAMDNYQPVVFAIAQDASLWEHTNSGWVQWALAGSVQGLNF